MRHLLLPLGFTWFVALGSARAFATALPESYPLGDAADSAPVDANLTAWLAQHSGQPNPLEMDDKAFDAFAQKQDLVTSFYLKFLRLERASPPDAKAQRTLADQTLKAFETDQSASQSEVQDHPLLPFLYMELLKTEQLTAEERPKILTSFNQVGGGTCAQKERTFDAMTKENVASLSDDALKGLLAHIDSFRSNAFKRNALKKFLGLVPEGKQGVVSEKALAMAQAYPVVIKQTPWLRAISEKNGAKTDGPYPAFDEARKLAGKRLCSKAKDVIAAVLKTKQEQASLDEALTTAKAIDGCYRARSKELRAEFWKNLNDEMTKAYGMDGWAEAKLRLGFIHWSADNYAEAKPLFDEVIAKTAGKFKQYEARATFALARIAENENELPKAADLYKDYLTRFPEQENFEEALMALVLIHGDKGEWSEALSPLEGLIQTQDQAAPDKRSTSAMSFGLFWAGRIYLEQNRLKDAEEAWRRVASEYYSTYYGAIGHFMLEKLTGKKLALQPSHSPTFRMHTLREAFAPEDRIKIKRVESLIRLGLGGEAICELEEVDLADGKPEKVLVKSLFLHAAGHWLDAIKAYDSLPRTFRTSLAIGFERILFPRRYGDEVRALAKKAGVDPDLVLAIIRQESVFNPMARSPVGALGLMQLMPATASTEAKRLEANYVSADEKKLMKQRVANPMNLLVADTNLTLGIHHVKTLLSKYPGPVYVLSAYNASPSAAAKWMKSIPTKDVLAFIEKIPYKETRAYVKLVLRNYFYYKRWYGTPSENLPHLDAVTSPLVAMVNGDAKPKSASVPAESPTPAAQPPDAVAQPIAAPAEEATQ